MGRVNTLCIALATVCVLLFTFGGRFSARQMGIGRPPTAGSGWIVLGGAVLAAMIPLCALLGRGSGPAHVLPFRQAGQYAIWALAQQFVLQSFFYLRIESVLGGKPAVLVTAVLFGAAHIPVPYCAWPVSSGRFSSARHFAASATFFRWGWCTRGSDWCWPRVFQTPCSITCGWESGMSGFIRDFSSMSFWDRLRLGFVPPIVRWRAACLARDRTP